MRYLTVVTSIIALVGVVTGSILTQYLIDARVKESEFGRLRVEAYQGFFSAQANLKIAEASKDTDEIKKADFRLYESRLKVGLVGSAASIMSMVSLWNETSPAGKCSEPENTKNDAMIYQQMRKETFELYKQELEPIDLPAMARFIFRCRVD